MSKVFGMHMIALRPGIKPEDFERFVAEQIYPGLADVPGCELYIIKGDRGDREGKYMAVFEFASVAARNRLFPAPGQMSEEAQGFFARAGKALEEWATFATPFDVVSTDYVVVGK